MPPEHARLPPVFAVDETSLTAQIAMAAFRRIDANVLPAAVINRLPLTRDGVVRWTTGSDLYSLIADLCCVRTIMVTKEEERETDFTTQASDRFSEACASAKRLLKRFAKGPKAPAIRILGQDPILGGALKSIVAWDVVVDALLSESAFPSLPHLLESSSDLQSSAWLASEGFYKQANQVLRGFLEAQVVAVALATDKASFRLWRLGQYPGGPLRGKNGLLRRLQSNGILEEPLIIRFAALYKELNAEIHGSEGTFIHSGIFAGVHEGHVFRPDRLTQWCSRIIEAVEISLPTLRAEVDRWQSESRDSSTCNVCREGPLVERDTFGIGAKSYRRRQCDACQTEDTVEIDSGCRVWIVSQNTTLKPVKTDVSSNQAP
jgi:hypothetical protein